MRVAVDVAPTIMQKQKPVTLASVQVDVQKRMQISIRKKNHLVAHVLHLRKSHLVVHLSNRLLEIFTTKPCFEKGFFVYINDKIASSYFN